MVKVQGGAGSGQCFSALLMRQMIETLIHLQPADAHGIHLSFSEFPTRPMSSVLK